MTRAEALNAAMGGLEASLAASAIRQRQDTITKLRIGHKFSPAFSGQIINDRAKGKYLNDPEFDQAISDWLWLTADNDRKAAERAEQNAARMQPAIDARTYDLLRGQIGSYYTFFEAKRPLPLIRQQFTAWIEATKKKRASLNPAQRRSIAACQGAFNRRLRRYELSSLQRAGVCP